MTQAIESVIDASAANLSVGDAALDALLNEIGDTEILGETLVSEGELSLSGDVIEEGASAIAAIAQAAGEGSVEDLLDQIGADANLADAKRDLYAAQPAAALPAGEIAPETTAELAAAVAETKKGGKGKGKGKGAAKKASADADEAEKVEKVEKPVKEKKAPTPSSVTHKPGELLRYKLGEKAGDYLALHLSDADLSATELAEKQQAFIDRMNDKDAIADKVRDKMSMLLVWMARGGELNEVLKRTFTVLHADGELTSGDKGNLQLNLLAKPYSMGTARSQGNQMFMALPELGLVLKQKGRMVPNPDSALLPMINSMLGLV